MAVGIYHFGNDNLRGAAILLGEGIGRLSRYQPEYADLDIAGFLQETKGLLTRVQQMSLQGSKDDGEGAIVYPKLKKLSC